MRRLVARLVGLCRRRQLDRDLEDEIAAHLEIAASDNMAKGMSPEEARLAARWQFGAPTRTKEAYREIRGFPILDTVARDIRYAFRGLRRAPAFSALAVSVLAVAIGANTAIFSVVNQLLIRPLAYRDADRLVAIDATRDYEGTPRPGHVFWQLDAARRWQAALRTFSEVTFYADEVYQLASRDGAELLKGATVAPSFFTAMDGPIVAGRPFTAADTPTPSIVISHRLATRLFNSPSGALGQRLVLNSTDYTVIGVAGPDWDMPSWKTDVWESSAFARIASPQCCGVQLLARLKPGFTVVQARADVADTARALAARDSRSFGRVHTTVTTLRDKQLGEGRAALLILWAAVVVVLLLACANTVNLLVARNLVRIRELSIRRALGASRGRLMFQGLTESALLAMGGVAGGLVIARLAIAALARVDPETFPRLGGVHLDMLVLLFAAALGVVTTVATGLVPSMQAARATPPPTVTNAPTRRHRQLLRVLCATQLGAAVVLLVSATLLGRSLVDLLGTDLGVTPDSVVTASINSAFRRPHTAEEIAGTIQRVLDRVQQMPGVRAAGAGTSLPPDTSRLMMSLKRKSDDVDYVASAVSCTPGYFQALGVRLLKGRFFTDADNAQHPPVIIVSATTARHLFGTDDPIGQTLTVPKFRYSLASGKDATVVGIVSDVKYSGIDATAGDQVYWSLAQAPWLSTFLTVRTAGDVDIASGLRHVVASVDPTIAVSSIKSLDAILATATAPARFRTTLVIAFALIGVGIAAIGLYGIVSYSVSQRTAEIGIRVALGADARRVRSLVLREGVAIAAAGVTIGLPTAYLTSRLFANLLFGIKSTDPLTYVASAGGLIVVALIASYAPARRAASVDPLVALRAE